MKQKESKKKSLNLGLEIDGVKYIKRSQAIQMAGTTYPTFAKKIKKFGIEAVSLPMHHYKMFRLKDIQEAIRKGWFQQYV